MSDFTATVILVLCFYPLLPIIAGVMANEAKAKKNIVIGCTLPFTAQMCIRDSACAIIQNRVDTYIAEQFG